jgi:hypothetical protein
MSGILSKKNCTLWGLGKWEISPTISYLVRRQKRNKGIDFYLFIELLFKILWFWQIKINTLVGKFDY